METISFRPVTQREQQIASSLGATGWAVLDERPVLCMGMQPALLIQKSGHIRWIKKEQATNVKS